MSGTEYVTIVLTARQAIQLALVVEDYFRDSSISPNDPQKVPEYIVKLLGDE